MMNTLVELIHGLFEEGKLKGLLRKQQIVKIQYEAQTRNPSVFIKAPSRNTVLEAMKRAEVDSLW